jgi:hypothetical protein
VYALLLRGAAFAGWCCEIWWLADEFILENIGEFISELVPCIGGTTVWDRAEENVLVGELVADVLTRCVLLPDGNGDVMLAADAGLIDCLPELLLGESAGDIEVGERSAGGVGLKTPLPSRRSVGLMLGGCVAGERVNELRGEDMRAAVSPWHVGEGTGRDVGRLVPILTALDVGVILTARWVVCVSGV